MARKIAILIFFVVMLIIISKVAGILINFNDMMKQRPNRRGEELERILQEQHGDEDQSTTSTLPREAAISLPFLY